MKKRILSMLLAIVMIVTLVPVSALAKYRGDIKYAVTGGYIYFDTSRGGYNGLRFKRHRSNYTGIYWWIYRERDFRWIQRLHKA